ncbi:UDP-glucose dehydrogenase family protein [Thermofilum pendens]|uniref:UDP-glucose 6-dehydrogenase n=1 Tax=Thermofilum pendens (strain DSM 2475 / Hrk 5) TaxID=368408 RepID=A1S0Y4_THEPD|nr:UDP-glucose/GDP-mannose dehydrogenase family protein [Thermofilum pendens]ABL79114.1 UDP-glucose 6-dehydrogenase [Thermofilum pendens Hrk 5]
MDRVAVIGLGYAGLPFAVALAHRGFKVVGVDTDEEKVELINKGVSPVYEPALNDYLKGVLERGLFKATTSVAKAIEESDVVFVFVGTPTKADGSLDLTQLENASEDIGRALKDEGGYKLIVVRSTVLPGTTEGVVKRIIEERSGKICGRDFGLCMNPEFLREGKALYDIFNPARIVIGEYDKRSGDILESVYRRFHGEKMPPVIRTSIVNAELIKYAANAFLAMKVSFINLIARIAQRLPRGDVIEVASGIGLDPRIGRDFLDAGLGFGGSCLPKDLRALIKLAKSLGVDAKLLEAILEVNETQIDEALELLRRALGDLRGKRIAVLGLAFKPGTDDVRESQSIKLVKRLAKEGAVLHAHDPLALDAAKRVLQGIGNVAFFSDVYECARRCDAIVVATDWGDYRNLCFERLGETMARRVVIDCRHIIDAVKASKAGFKYYGLGIYTE